MSVAAACAAQMWAGDRASATLGLVLGPVSDGAAEVSMTVIEAMVNGHGTCHGGFIFALADTAFAFACNSHGAHAVAAQCHVAFLNPARIGDVLVATATERWQEGRSGITDVTVRAGGTVVAEFRGHSRTTGGRFDV